MKTISQGKKVWILDVGHGNSAVVKGLGYVFVIDGGRGGTLRRFLKEQQITRVNAIIVSHADADHFGGVSVLLANSDIQVDHIYVNPDSRANKLWMDFATVMTEAQQRGTQIHLELNQASPKQLIGGGIQLDVLGPSQGLAVRTTNHLDPDGRRMAPNAMSAVVRISAGDSTRVLLPGDIDQIGLNRLLENNPSIEADVLVFPHHGGHPGQSDSATFAQTLMQAVAAKFVVFSIGRGQHNTPQPVIVDSVLRHRKGVRIACTQLSEHCASKLPNESGSLHVAVAQGSARNTCCAGTLEISLESKDTYLPTHATHIDFIDQHAPTALCRQP